MREHLRQLLYQLPCFFYATNARIIVFIRAFVAILLPGNIRTGDLAEKGNFPPKLAFPPKLSIFTAA